MSATRRDRLQDVIRQDRRDYSDRLNQWRKGDGERPSATEQMIDALLTFIDDEITTALAEVEARARNEQIERDAAELEAARYDTWNANTRQPSGFKNAAAWLRSSKSRLLGEHAAMPTTDEYQRVTAQLDEERGRVVEADVLLGKLTRLLTRTANVIKGEPDELTLHSWHDLPELARELVERAGQAS